MLDRVCVNLWSVSLYVKWSCIIEPFLQALCFHIVNVLEFVAKNESLQLHHGFTALQVLLGNIREALQFICLRNCPTVCRMPVPSWLVFVDALSSWSACSFGSLMQLSDYFVSLCWCSYRTNCFILVIKIQKLTNSLGAMFPSLLGVLRANWFPSTEAVAEDGLMVSLKMNLSTGTLSLLKKMTATLSTRPCYKHCSYVIL